MHRWHAKSPCCNQNLSLRFSTPPMQLLQTYVENSEQTWRVQCSASTSWFEKKLFLDGVPLEKSRPRPPTPLTAQGFSRRFRREAFSLRRAYFRFRRQERLLYVMAVKPCRQNRAVFLDSLLLPSRDSSPLVQAIATIPDHPQTDLGPGL